MRTERCALAKRAWLSIGTDAKQRGVLTLRLNIVSTMEIVPAQRPPPAVFIGLFVVHIQREHVSHALPGPFLAFDFFLSESGFVFFHVKILVV